MSKLPYQVWLIFSLGLVIRTLFLLFGAEAYYGDPHFYIDADTGMYARSIVNLINEGVYTAKLGHPDGYFLRTPGYPLFMGIFYWLSGKDLILTYKMVIWVQVILDAFATILVFLIMRKVTRHNNVALIAALLYATYPFIIVWNAIVYAESASIFFMLLSLWCFLNDKLRHHYLLAGAFLAIALLMRPQIAFLYPGLVVALVYANREQLTVCLKPILLLTLGLSMVYLPWPMRNYFAHDKLVFVHDYGAANDLAPDVSAFWNYIFALKAEWEPQFSNILHNKDVSFPDDAYVVPGDSLLLARAVKLSKECGSGFSSWREYWKEPVDGGNCDQEIASLFNQLRDHQISHNKLNYYLIVPLTNLKKALFKFSLNDQGTWARALASNLFLYRSILLVLGLLGTYLLLKRSSSEMIGAVILISGLSWIVYMAWVHRNMEIRYLLPSDVLFLLPSAYAIWHLLQMVRGRGAV